MEPAFPMLSDRETPEPPLDEVSAWRRESLRADVLFLRARYAFRSFQRHIHDWFVIGLNVGGAHRSYTRGRDLAIPTGRISLINPGEVHSGTRIGPDPWSFRAFHVAPAFLRTLMGSGADRRLQFVEGVVDDPVAFARLARVHRVAETSDRVDLRAQLVEALGDLADRYGKLVRHESPGPSAGRGVLAAREHIEAHFTRRLSLEDMASVAGLSRFHFVRRFTREIGMTPHAFLVDLRVREAVRLLTAGWPPGRVAYAAGFADQSHLTRCFKRSVGIPPGRFVNL